MIRDKPLNEAEADKIRKYHADYNNNPPNSISFMPAIASTSGRLHSEFVRFLFLQAHRETDRVFTGSGVHLAQQNRGDFHYRRTVFSSQLNAKTVSILAKASSLRLILNIDGSPILSKSHTHPSHSQTSRWLYLQISRNQHFFYMFGCKQLSPRLFLLSNTCHHCFSCFQAIVTTNSQRCILERNNVQNCVRDPGWETLDPTCRPLRPHHPTQAAGQHSSNHPSHPYQ